MKMLTIIPLLLVAACATRPPPPPQTINTACITFAPISFAQSPPGQVDDPGNKADSDPTVEQVHEHNAKWDATCGNAAAPK